MAEGAVIRHTSIRTDSKGISFEEHVVLYHFNEYVSMFHVKLFVFLLDFYVLKTVKHHILFPEDVSRETLPVKTRIIFTFPVFSSIIRVF